MGRWLEQKKIEEQRMQSLPVSEQEPRTRWKKSLQADTIAIQKGDKPETQFMKGSFFQKVLDPLLAGQYGIAGLGREMFGLEEKGEGIMKGIQNRASWVDTFQEKFPYEASTDWKKNFVQELGRVTPGVIADIILDPLWLIPPLKIAQIMGLTKLGKPIRSSKILEPVRNLFGKAFIPRYGQPDDYIELAEKNIRKIREGEDIAKIVVEPITKLPIKDQRTITKIMTGEAGKYSDKLRSIAQPGIDQFKNLGKEAVKENLLNQKAFLENYGKYLPRLYKTKEAPKGLIQFKGDKKPIRADLDRFKKKKDIPEHIRAAYGEIKEAGYPTAKGIAQLYQAIEMSKFFKQVAKNPQWFSKTAKEGFIRLPSSRTLGTLKDGYVIEPIYNDISQWVRIASKGEKIARQALGTWKYFKVVLNPATHARNMMSNVILADLGGLPFWRGDIWARALQDLSKKGKYFQEMKKNSNILFETYFARDIQDLLGGFNRATGNNVLSKMKNMIGRLGEKTGSIYQAEEQWSKLALYIYQREVKGLSSKAAAKVSEKFLFDYSKVPPLIDLLRGSGRYPMGALGLLSGAYPFITFSYKAIPRIVEIALVKTPRLTKWQKAISGVEKLSPEEETKKEREVFAEWMKTGMWMKVPFKDKEGRSQYLDLNFILPWGDIGEVGNSLTPSNPIFVLLSDLIHNKSAYTKRKIVKDGLTKKEGYEEQAKYILRTILPSLVPPGYSYEKIISALLQKPDYQGRTRSLFTTFLDTFLGLKTRPIDYNEELRWRLYEKKQKIVDIRTRLVSDMLNKGIAPEQKEKIREKRLKEIQKVIKEYTFD